MSLLKLGRSLRQNSDQPALGRPLRVLLVALAGLGLAGLGAAGLGAAGLGVGEAAAKTKASTAPRAGYYDISKAANPAGSSYTGAVDISRAGRLYHLRWDLGGRGTHRGVGLFAGDRLGAAWSATPSGGVVVYRVDKGKLTGRWAGYGGSAEGREDLSGPPGLNGRYRITLGATPAGGKYSGQVEIKPQGNAYALTWTLSATESYTGVGMLVGDHLYAGWGAGSGVVVYKRKGNELLGRWVTPSGADLGQEDLKLRPPTKKPKPGAEPVPGVAGDYNIKLGENPGGGGTYSGSVRWEPYGKTYAIDWKIGGGGYTGVGLPVPNTDLVAVGWGASGKAGVAAYQVSGGRLQGVWALESQAGVGTEELSGPPGLSGSYQITKGLDAAGKQYSGKVEIQPSGQTYAVRWLVGSSVYTGVGILRDKSLVVGWGAGTGVVIYQRSKQRLAGVWAVPSGTALGKEVLVR